MVNVKPVQLGKNTRMSFNRINEVLDMPNLIEVQKNSYKWFLEEGLKEVFRDISAITDYQGNLVLDFIDYRMENTPKYSIEECKERDTTYAAPLRVRASLYNKETGEVKEQDIFMGDFPLMTDSGTFIINGAERVIVSQLVRSPGVYYSLSRDKAGKELFSSTVIPNRGAWLEYETDSNDIFHVRIDKNRKLPVTTFVRALGLGSNEEIEAFFGQDILIQSTLEKDATKNIEEALLEVYRKLRPGEPPTVDSAQTHIDNLFFDPRRYDLSRVGRYKYNKKLAISGRIIGQTLAEAVVNPLTGEMLAEAGDIVSREKAEEIEAAGVDTVFVAVNGNTIKVISNGMVNIGHFVGFDCKDIGINEKVRFSVLREILDSAEGEEALREEIGKRVDDLIPKHIIKDDIFASVNYMCNLQKGLGNTDDIDHLGNRRIRSVGELLQNQFRIGFSRMER
ncbi:MAG: DNA-directed RNA polymerase subunit beta, partial [Oscillospiraceae bacterium]|nr:DNA-directed RNA polymerase subunit beta [Oscillospiraceae bacterium]